MKCKECKYCEILGYTEVVKKVVKGGRALYYCNYSGFNNFIGYGDGTLENPLQLKTSKRWCPLKQRF